MKYNIKQSSLLMLFALFLVAFCFIACDDRKPPIKYPYKKESL